MSISQDLSALLSANWVVLIHARRGWQYSLHARCSLLQGHFLVAQRVLQLHVTDGRVSLVSVLLTGGTVAGAPVLMGGSVIGVPALMGGMVVGAPVLMGGMVAGVPVLTGGTVAGAPVVMGGMVAGAPALMGGMVAGAPVLMGGMVAGAPVLMGGTVAGWLGECLHHQQGEHLHHVDDTASIVSCCRFVPGLSCCHPHGTV